MSDRKNIPVRSSSGNIGAGLTRINLGAGVASLLDDRKERRTSPSTGLTPARSVSLLGTNVSRGGRSSGERYQSAYSRLGGLRGNGSAPNVSSPDTPSGRTTGSHGRDTRVSVTPRRSNISSLCETSDTLDGKGFTQPKHNIQSTTGDKSGDIESETNPDQKYSDMAKVNSSERFPKVSSQPSLHSADWYVDHSNSSAQDLRYNSPRTAGTKVNETSQLRKGGSLSFTPKGSPKNVETGKDLTYSVNENVIHNTHRTSDLVSTKQPSSVQRNKSFEYPRQLEVINSRPLSPSSRHDTSGTGIDVLKMTGTDTKVENQPKSRFAESVKSDRPSGTDTTPKQGNRNEVKPSPYDGLSDKLLERQRQYRYLETDVGNSHAVSPGVQLHSHEDEVDGDDNDDDDDDDPYASINDTTIEADEPFNSVNIDVPHSSFTSITSGTKGSAGVDDTYLLPTPPRRTRTKSGDRARLGGDGQGLVVSPSQPDRGSPPQARIRMKRRLTKRNIGTKRVDEDEFIGFASLPEQVHRKAVRRGFEFTLMVVGETGLGKSTLINSLFLTDLYKGRKVVNIEERIHKTVDIETKELEIEERGVKLKLTIVDTPGFNDNVNAEESWKPIVQFIDKQFENYFKAESGLNRKNLQDTRVHCCLYFISPYGHGLRPVDISVMKRLHNKVNIVPLIAKADMLTKPEVKRLKEKVLREVERHRIQLYQFPDCDSDEDEDFKQQDKELKASIPFAVVGSNTVVEAGGKKVRGRMYPWGIVEVENPKHCDFIKLRQMLISTHMQDLKDVTCDAHYENYRAEHIAEQMYSQQKERNKLKRDSSPNLDAVLETDKLLQQKDEEIRRMQAMLSKMQAQLHNSSSPQINGRVGHQV